jgi:hypothetical protein
MNIFKEQAPIEVKLKKVEELMRELQLHIEWNTNGFKVTNQESGQFGYIQDIESTGPPSSLPRTFESERLVVPSN